MGGCHIREHVEQVESNKNGVSCCTVLAMPHKTAYFLAVAFFRIFRLNIFPLFALKSRKPYSKNSSAIKNAVCAVLTYY